ncbi:hypothetical protein TGGT1_411020 [Toxoplasma gondii GT1]|uniref:Uncharacterized protein n=1 Tax=Toxoplasma gondii (strain ATCC 50853 / GT1) TaxID=507601 RepID=S7UGL6_TOXGG|nr:hypothetical protein TGGT1_411020 [Toxoplasma gondii GT1]
MTCCRYPSESECSAWDAWTNPAAEANDPISLVSEYAACGVWRPHMALPFSRMSLVAYLRGWVARVVPRGLTALWHELSTCWVWRRHMVRALYVCLGDGRPFCSAVGGLGCVDQSSCGSERSEFTRFGIPRLCRVAAAHGPAFFPYESRRVPARMDERLLVVCRGAVCLRGCWAFCSGPGCVRQRSDGTLARFVDVLGVAAPHGSAVCLRDGCGCCSEADKSECPAWDAWTNPVAEANDPSALVSEYAACGVWRPHMALPFSRMSLVAYLRGWALKVREEKDAGACGAPQRSGVALARIVDVLGVAAPHGPGVVWYVTRRVNAQMGERLLVVCRRVVCLGDGRAYCPGAGGKGAKGPGGGWCVSWRLLHHVA